MKALDRRAKVLRKLAGKLKGGDENLHLKIEYLRQALEVIYALTLQQTFSKYIYNIDKTMGNRLFVQTKLKINSISKLSQIPVCWDTLY